MIRLTLALTILAQVPKWAFQDVRCSAITCYEGELVEVNEFQFDGGIKIDHMKMPGYCVDDLVNHPCSESCLTVYVSVDGGKTCSDGFIPDAGFESYGNIIYPKSR